MRTETPVRRGSIFDGMVGSGQHSLFAQPIGTSTYRPQPRKTVATGLSGYLPKHIAPPRERGRTMKQPSFGIKVPKPDREGGLGIR